MTKVQRWITYKNLIIKLIKNSPQEIIESFAPTEKIPNWQVRLIKEPELLDENCPSKYIAISKENDFCYLLKSQRPRDIDGGIKIQ